MWVQLVTKKTIEIAGEHKTYQPGDWIDVGKQLALQWLATGEAVLQGEFETASICDFDGEYGIIVNDMNSLKSLGERLAGCKFQHGDIETIKEIPYSRSVFYDASASVSPAYFAIGFGLLETWEIAIPLMDYSLLAQDVGNDEDKEITQSVIHDLRVPLYDLRLIFLCQNDTSARLLDQYHDEQGNRHLAFLRALYKIKPFILALPCVWTNHNAPR